MPSDEGAKVWASDRLTRCPPAQKRTSVVERAFELAREGKDLAGIRAGLKAEGYENASAQLYGPQLLASLKRARPAP